MAVQRLQLPIAGIIGTSLGNRDPVEATGSLAYGIVALENTAGRVPGFTAEARYIHRAGRWESSA